MDQSLEERVSAIEDRLEIAQLRARYCHCVDQRRWDDLMDLFTDDVEFQGRLDQVHGKDALMAYFERSSQAMEAFWHRSMNETLELDGDRASGAAYFDAPCVVNGTAMLCAGRYEDAFVKRDARWLFSSRTMTFFYFTPLSEGWREGALPEPVAAR